MEYRIKEVWKGQELYVVQVRKSFLGFKYWSYVYKKFGGEKIITFWYCKYDAQGEIERLKDLEVNS